MDNPISAMLASLPGMATKAAQPERQEPGPGDVGPTTETKGTNELVSLQMTEDECSQWWERVERARNRIKEREKEWDILLDEYLPTVVKGGEPESVKMMTHFRNLHSKIGQLFYRDPDLTLQPKDPSPAQDQLPNPMQAMLPPGAPQLPPITMEDIIAIKQAVLKDKLGPEAINAARLFDELLFDVLGWAGIGCYKTGYRCVTKQVQKPRLIPVPQVSQPGAVLGLGVNSQTPPQGQPPQMMPDPSGAMEPQDVPIYEEWYARRFSPKKYLCNDDLKSTRYDEDSTWQGMEFYMSPKKAMAAFGITEEQANKAAEDDRVHPYKEDKANARVTLVRGVELWVKASHFTDEMHPLAYNQLVLIEGIKDKPVVWRPSPDQEFDADGKLTPDSLIGNPIQVLTIRDLADSCFPPSDAAFTNAEIKQLTTWRRQSIKIRDAATGKYLYDAGAFDDADIDNFKNGTVGDYIAVKEGLMNQGRDKILDVAAQVHQTNDDYQGAAAIKRDIDETLGISPVQAGVAETTVRSATETQAVASSSQARNDKELGRVMAQYIKLARMIDQLLMRYATELEYINIGGDNAARRMMVWNKKLISGRFLYDIAPDSQNRLDTAKDFQLTASMYNLAAKDPLFNRTYVLRRMARARGMDPAKAVMDQASLPKPQPPRPTVSIALKGEDLLSPMIVLNLERMGLLPPEGAPPTPQGQPPHGGPNSGGETISQHMASNSGDRPNEPGSTDHRAAQVK